MRMRRPVERPHALLALQQADGRGRHRALPGEALAAIEQLRCLAAAHAGDPLQHQPDAERVRAEPRAAVGDEQIALAQEGRRRVEGRVVGDRHGSAPRRSPTNAPARDAFKPPARQRRPRIR
jgi:hypothetical protein